MSQAEKINEEKLASSLEPMIRRIVREELKRVLKKEPDIFQLTPEMPLYEDMEEISQRKAQDQIKLHSHAAKEPFTNDRGACIQGPNVRISAAGVCGSTGTGTAQTFRPRHGVSTESRRRHERSSSSRSSRRSRRDGGGG